MYVCSRNMYVCLTEFTELLLKLKINGNGINIQMTKNGKSIAEYKHILKKAYYIESGSRWSFYHIIYNIHTHISVN